MSHSLLPSACRLAVRLTNNPRAEVYIRACEHQDGEEYWLNFGTPEEVIEDFVLYYESWLPPLPREANPNERTD